MANVQALRQSPCMTICIKGRWMITIIMDIYTYLDRTHTGVNHVWSLCPCALTVWKMSTPPSTLILSVSIIQVMNTPLRDLLSLLAQQTTMFNPQGLSSSGTVYNFLHALAHTRTGPFVSCDSIYHSQGWSSRAASPNANTAWSPLFRHGGFLWRRDLTITI